MDTNNILISLFIAVVVLFKLYTVRKKGIKTVLRQKLMTLPVIAIIFGVITLIYPNFNIADSKQVIIDYIDVVMR